ncbi:MAG TPA: hypothetical protein VGU65_10030 [Frateuria sp.]|uniref:hypothetical protein n=1 Tax=Frateuria sp. TaxID=2211372 RepID=UPI002DF5622A|nr:hypothetical protein [Frateuria sp.]
MDTRIGLDKMRVRYTYGNSISGNADYQRLQGWVGSSLMGDFGTKGKLQKVHPEGSLTNVHQKLPEGGYLHLMYGEAGKKQSLWVEFNPAKLSANDLAALKGHLSILLEDGFATLVYSGWMSRVEINIDVDGAVFGDYLYVDTSLRTSNAAYEHSGTMYIGGQKSNRRFTVYDKSKEQSYGGIYAAPTLRVEAILQNRKGFPLAQTIVQPSPFLTLLILNRAALGKSSDPTVGEFIKRAKAPGHSAQAAYQSFPLKQRKGLQQALQELQPAWWQPANIWCGFPASLGWMAYLAEP